MAQTEALIKEMTASYKYSITIEYDRDVITVKLYNNWENTTEYLISSDTKSLNELLVETYKQYKE